MTKKDFLASIVLIAFSTTIIVMSYTMPRLERRGIDPFSAPGVVPGMIGAVLLCLALILFVRSVRNGGYRIFSKAENSGDTQHQKGVKTRVLLTLVLSLIYAIGFLGHLDYTLGTGIYIFSFICLFEIQPGRSIWDQKKTILLALVQATVTSFLVSLVFQNLFLVDLP